MINRDLIEENADILRTAEGRSFDVLIRAMIAIVLEFVRHQENEERLARM